MPTLIRLTYATGLIVVVVLVITFMRNRVSQTNDGPKRRHVVLIGASIGQAWQLAKWPDREAVPQFTAESVAAWQFDKSEVLEETLMRPAMRFRFTRTYVSSLFQPAPKHPDIIILKECSSYFPGDVDIYMQRIREWVCRIRTHNVVPVLATVVPVTRARSARDLGKQDSLLDYNRRLREYALQESIAVVDLEAALCKKVSGKFLAEEYALGDGSHLNAKAYAILDKTLRTVLYEIPSSSALPR